MPALSLGEAERLHLEDLQLRGKSPESVRTYRSIEGSFLAWLSAVGGGPPTVAQLDVAVLNRWRAHLEAQGRPGDTVGQYLRTIKSLAAFLSRPDDDGLPYLRRNPLATLKTPPRHRPAIKIFGEDEIDKLFGACRDTEWPIRSRALLRLLYDTGVRIGEACALRVGDVELATVHKPRGSVTVHRGKGGKARPVPVPFGLEASRALGKWLNSSAGRAGVLTATDALWITRQGHPWLAGNVRDWMRRLGDRAGVDDTHPHRWRRSAATNWAKQGMGHLLIMEMLGHSSLEQTRKYVRVAELLEAGYRSPGDELERTRRTRRRRADE